MIRNGNIFMTITEFEQKLPIYLTLVGSWRNQYRIERDEGFPDYQWIQCMNGKGTLRIGENEFSVKKNQGMLLFPNEPHEYFSLEEPWEVRWFAFNGMQVKEMLSLLGFNSSMVLTLSNPEALLKGWHKMMSTAGASNQMKGLRCSSLLYDIILRLYRYGSNVDIKSRQHRITQISPALRYIEDHYKEPITLREISGVLSVTPQHTCLLFQKTLGIQPMKYLTQVRMRKAKELLHQDPELSIAAVAEQVGYEHTSYFIKIFKQHEGMTPKKFREYSLALY